MKLNLVVVVVSLWAGLSLAERVYHHQICNNFLQKSFRGSCEQCCVKKGFDKDLSVCVVGSSCTCAKEMEVRPEDRIYLRETTRDESVCSLSRRGLNRCGDCCSSHGFNHHLKLESKLAKSCICIRREQLSYDQIKDSWDFDSVEPDLSKLFPN